MAGYGSNRPTGITVLAILAFIGGAFGLLGGLVALFAGGLATAVAGPIGVLVSLVGLVVLVMSAAQLALGYGFWTLKEWAWQAGIVIEAVMFVLALLQILSGTGSSFISLIIDGAIIYYLNRPDVRLAFRAPTTGFPVVGNSLDRYIPR